MMPKGAAHEMQCAKPRAEVALAWASVLSLDRRGVSLWAAATGRLRDAFLGRRLSRPEVNSRDPVPVSARGRDARDNWTLRPRCSAGRC
jgi:hypothetical protein